MPATVLAMTKTYQGQLYRDDRVGKYQWSGVIAEEADDGWDVRMFVGDEYRKVRAGLIEDVEINRIGRRVVLAVPGGRVVVIPKTW